MLKKGSYNLVKNTLNTTVNYFTFLGFFLYYIILSLYNNQSI